MLGSCGAPPPAVGPGGTRDQLITGEALSADSDEVRHDLLLQLQDRTGRFINLLDGSVSEMLRQRDLSPQQRTWLRTLRLDGVQGILWAIQQEDIVDSEIETLFFSRLLHRLKATQAADRFDSAWAGRINTMLADMEALFWKPVAGHLDNWELKIANAVDAFIRRRPDSPSIAFTSSDLYVVADHTERDRLSGMFGLDARLEMAAKGIGYLNQTAERAVFVAEFMPLMLTLHAEVTVADLLDSLTAGSLADVPGRLDDAVNALLERLTQQRHELSESLRETSEALATTLARFEADLGVHIDALDATIGREIRAITGRIAAMEQSARQLDANVASLASAIDRLSSAVEDIPEDVIATIADPPPDTAAALDEIEARLQFNLALVIVGTMVGGMVIVWVGVGGGRRRASRRAGAP
jgi:methyl-accepting chemotaxis protein